MAGVFSFALTMGEEDFTPGSYLINAYRIGLSECTLDGALDESFWARVEPVTSFVQMFPDEGSPATEKTDVRIAFDEHNLYFAAICHSRNPENLVADERRRDGDLYRNDFLSIILNPLHDQRNGVVFVTNPQGARTDGVFLSESGFSEINWDWDEIWDVEARMTGDGWQVEIRIPFSSLRFNPQSEVPWGMTLHRGIKANNEEATWPPIPREQKVTRLSLAGELHGLKNIKAARRLEVKPFALLRGEKIPSVGMNEYQSDADIGLDVKVALTPNLTLDLTANTDFSQTESDSQQINLTRFSLFFPEKREFFLEGSQYFQFGRNGLLQPFHSRRIGLASGEPIPLWGGVKLSGKAGHWGLGALSMFSRSHRLMSGARSPATGFGVLRIKRDLWKRSSVGIFAVARRPDGEGDTMGTRENTVAGADIDLQFFKNTSFGFFAVKSWTAGLHSKDQAGQFRYFWKNPSWTMAGSLIIIEENFRADTGFVPRTDVIRSSPLFVYHPYLNRQHIREVSISLDTEYWTDTKGLLLTRVFYFKTQLNFQNGGNVALSINPQLERIQNDFWIWDDVLIPPDRYEFMERVLSASGDNRKKIFFHSSLSAGTFFGGTRRRISPGVHFRPNAKWALELHGTRQQVRLPGGRFQSDLVSVKSSYSFSTKMFLNGLVQYNSDTNDVTSNLRFRWIYREGSDFFIVYNERRVIEGAGPDYYDRELAVKWTYQFNL